jgi:hypothetical protein
VKTAIVAAALLLCAVPAKSDPLDDIMATTPGCLHNLLIADLAGGRIHGREALTNDAAARCEVVLIAAAQHFRPDVGKARIHAYVIDEADLQLDAIIENGEWKGRVE